MRHLVSERVNPYPYWRCGTKYTCDTGGTCWIVTLLPGVSVAVAPVDLIGFFRNRVRVMSLLSNELVGRSSF